MADAVEIRGLDDFRRALRSAGPAAARRLQVANKEVAQKVADQSSDAARARGGSAAKGAKSITARARGQSAAVAIGGARAPWMLGAEFGAKQYEQFPPWRGNQWQPFSGGVGYFVHPAIRRMRAEIEDGMLNAAESAARATGWLD